MNGESVVSRWGVGGESVVSRCEWDRRRQLYVVIAKE